VAVEMLRIGGRKAVDCSDGLPERPEICQTGKALRRDYLLRRRQVQLRLEFD